MSGFSGINQFGSLTTQSGQRLTFNDFDKDGDGKISQEEYDSVLKELNLDSVELSTVDKNGDKEISEDEFALWDQKIQMQDAVNELAGTISTDFAGKVELISQVTAQLKDCIDKFANEYEGDISQMAEQFKESGYLEAQYQFIKANILQSTPDTIKSSVLDEIYTELTQPAVDTRTGKAAEAMPAATAKRIATELEKEADKFIKSYTGNNLEADLKAHLEEYMNKSDAEKLQDAAAEFKANANTFGAMIDNGAELKQLKEYAKEFLTAALNAGVTIVLGGTTIKTTNAITSALAKFTDGDTLKAAIEEAIDNLSTTTLKETLIAEEEQKAQEAADKAFTDIKGSEYAVNASLLDYSGIDGYFNNGTISKKAKKKRAELNNQVKEQMTEIINNNLKSQMKAQIQEMLQAKGVPFEKIEQVFENVFNSSLVETLNADGMITGKHRTAFRRGESKINVKQCVDQFVTTFNTNIAKAIDEMNASDKDFDTVDLDMSVLGTDENGNNIETVNNDDILKSYQTGQPLTTKKCGGDYYVKIAEQIIDGLKAQMMAKARAMCTANGVEFDLTKFNSVFNNAKGIAVNAAVTGTGRSNGNTGVLAGGGAGLAVAGTAGVGALTATSAGFAAATPISTVLGLTVASSAVPVIGWAAAGVGAVAAGVMAIFGGGHHSESTLNTRTLVDGFTQLFKESYTQLVDEEKAKSKES